MIYALIFSIFGTCLYPGLTCQILKNNPNLEVSKAFKISSHVEDAAAKYGFDGKLYSAILMQESAYKLDAKGCNKHGCDYGIAQIHHKTAKVYKFDEVLLVTDLRYSIMAGAKVLGWFYKTYAKKEPKRWWVRYNCGTRKNIDRDSCNEYERKVRRWL